MLLKYIKIISSFFSPKVIYAMLSICWIAIVAIRKVDSGSIKSVLLSWDLFIATIPETALLFIIFAILVRYCGRIGIALVWALSLIFFIITAIQCYYFYISGEFVTQLALENINQLYLLLNVPLYIGIAFSICVILALWVNFNLHIKNIAYNIGGGESLCNSSRFTCHSYYAIQ